MERHFLCIFSHSSATWCPIEDLDPAQIYLPKTTFAFLACRISVGKRLSRVICYAEWFSVFPSWILPAEYDPVTWPKIRFLFKKAIQFSQHKNISSKNTFRDQVQSRGHPSQIFFRNQFARTVSAHNAIPINESRSLSSQSSQAKQNLSTAQTSSLIEPVQTLSWPDHPFDQSFPNCSYAKINRRLSSKNGIKSQWSSFYEIKPQSDNRFSCRQNWKTSTLRRQSDLWWHEMP